LEEIEDRHQQQCDDEPQDNVPAQVHGGGPLSTRQIHAPGIEALRRQYLR
jgi:hypothetical protein